ncbi:MAG: hypothetical protein ACPG8W_24220, partial [Candidatus Promineifilaceae bacterium]
MTPLEIATHAAADISASERYLLSAEIRPKLNLDTHLLITNKVLALVDSNAEAALCLAQANLAAATQQTKEDRARIFSLWGVGWALAATFAYNEAFLIYEEIAVYFQQQQEWRRLAGSYINGLWMLVNLGRYIEAIALEKQARAALTKADEDVRRSALSLEINIFRAYENTGQLAQAVVCVRRGLALAHELGDPQSKGKLKMTEGYLLIKLGRYVGAEASLVEAAQCFEETQNTTDMARTDLNLGRLHFRQGRYQRGLHHLEAAHTRFAKLHLPLEAANVEHQKAKVYFALNLLDESLTFNTQAHDKLLAHDLPHFHIEVLITQGRIRIRRNNYPQAKRALNQARQLALQFEALGMLPSIDILRIQIAQHEQRFDDVAVISAETVAQKHINNEPLLLAQLHLEVARSHLKQAQLADALEQLEAVRLLTEQFSLQEVAIQLRYLLGIYANQMASGRARAYYDDAIRLIDRQNASLPLDEFRVAYLSDKQVIYEALIRENHRAAIEKEAGALADLLKSLGRMYAAYLPQLLGASVSAATAQTGPDPLAELRARWYWHQTQLEERFSQQGTAEGVASVKNHPTPQSAASIEADIAEMLRQRRLRQTDNPDNQLDKSYSIGSIQTQLRVEQALLCFYLADEQCHLLLVTQTGSLHLTHLAAAEMVEQLLQAWRFHIGNQQAVQGKSGLMIARAYLQRLYRLLIRPIEAQLPTIAQLSILTPTLWHDLPFAALFDGKQYLVERCALSRLSSFDLGDQGVIRPKTSALVIGYSDE